MTKIFLRRFSGTPIGCFQVFLRALNSSSMVFLPGFMGDQGFKNLPVPGFFRNLNDHDNKSLICIFVQIQSSGSS